MRVQETTSASQKSKELLQMYQTKVNEVTANDLPSVWLGLPLKLL
jgi:hypothetical protein